MRNPSDKLLDDVPNSSSLRAVVSADICSKDLQRPWFARYSSGFDIMSTTVKLEGLQ